MKKTYIAVIAILFSVVLFGSSCASGKATSVKTSTYKVEENTVIQENSSIEELKLELEKNSIVKSVEVVVNPAPSPKRKTFSDKFGKKETTLVGTAKENDIRETAALLNEQPIKKDKAADASLTRTATTISSDGAIKAVDKDKNIHTRTGMSYNASVGADIAKNLAPTIGVGVEYMWRNAGLFADLGYTHGLEIEKFNKSNLLKFSAGGTYSFTGRDKPFQVEIKAGLGFVNPKSSVSNEINVAVGDENVTFTPYSEVEDKFSLMGKFGVKFKFDPSYNKHLKPNNLEQGESKRVLNPTYSLEIGGQYFKTKVTDFEGVTSKNNNFFFGATFTVNFDSRWLKKLR